jgi:hypothetical protein
MLILVLLVLLKRPLKYINQSEHEYIYEPTKGPEGIKRPRKRTAVEFYRM